MSGRKDGKRLPGGTCGFGNNLLSLDDLVSSKLMGETVGASGNLIVFIPEKLDPASVFATTELEQIFKNDTFKYINGIPKDELEAIYRKGNKGKESVYEIFKKTAKDVVGDTKGIDSQAEKLLKSFSEDGILNSKSSGYSITSCYDAHGNFIGIELESSKSGILIDRPKKTASTEMVVQADTQTSVKDIGKGTEDSGSKNDKDAGNSGNNDKSKSKTDLDDGRLSDKSKKYVDIYEDATGTKVKDVPDVNKVNRIAEALDDNIGKAADKLNKVGNVMDLVDLAATICQAGKFFGEGKEDEAGKVLRDYGFSTLMSVALSESTAILLASLAVTNPILLLVAVGTMAYCGSEMGKELSDLLDEVLGLNDGGEAGTMPADPPVALDYHFGTAGDDTINAGNGNDLLDGGKGNDTLNGGYGDDTYLFSLGDGNDVIYDTAGNDKILFGENITKEDLVFSRSNNDLCISVMGTDQSIVNSNYYCSPQYRVEEIETSDGYALDCQKLDQVIQAMAGCEDETGMGWQDAVEQDSQYTRDLMDQWWTQKTG